MSELLGGLAEWAVDVVHALGYLGLAALVILENVFPPIPSEVVLPLAGFLVGQERFSFVPAVVTATTGSVIGALILYAPGRWLGEYRLRTLVRRFGRYAMVGESDVDRAYAWFDRYGGQAVFFGRLVPGIRSLISIPAGLHGMPVGRFIVFTAAGSCLWNSTLIGLGWALGDQWHRVENYVQMLTYAVVAMVGTAVVWFVWSRLRAWRPSNRL